MNHKPGFLKTTAKVLLNLHKLPRAIVFARAWHLARKFIQRKQYEQAFEQIARMKNQVDEGRHDLQLQLKLITAYCHVCAGQGARCHEIIKGIGPEIEAAYGQSPDGQYLALYVEYLRIWLHGGDGVRLSALGRAVRGLDGPVSRILTSTFPIRA